MIAITLALQVASSLSCQVPGESSNQPNTSFRKALLALQQNRLQEALDEVTQAERETPEDPRVRSFRGIALAGLGRSAEAEVEYRAAINIDPQMADAYRNLGFLEWKQHRLKEAVHSLEQAASLAPGDSFAHYYLGRVDLETQRYEQAFKEFKRSGSELPHDPEFLLAEAVGYLALQQRNDAVAVLRRVDPSSLSLSQGIQMAALLAKARELDKATQLLRSLGASVRGEHADCIHFDLALLSLLKGDFQTAVVEAIPLTREPIQGVVSATNRDTAWSLLGIAYAREGEIDPALKALRRAAELDPQKEDHWINLTRELMEVSRYADAITAMREGLASIPQSYALHLRAGAANLAAGHYADAEAAFRELVAAGDPLPMSYVGLAQVLLRTGRAEEAVSELAAARNKLGPVFLISYFQGLCLARADKRLEAVAAFQEAIQLSPESAEAHLGLGKAQLALGHIAEGTAQLEETLRLHPDDVQAARLLKQARYRQGNKEMPIDAIQLRSSIEEKSLGDFILPEWQIPLEASNRP